ncbi:helix-turn-helix transcriptional regulator [Devosia ginsengisoli]|uniref:helix-turn-helix domain-containing protein n=1 Tax=Devosia ginsengisoli TaxID=400770 RepID=UPI0026F12147|nr:helix-turn-helix transcriptional regulator [Devosia ginsengisoli]MCR6671735.1 helix-turn-helix domain-containing protein [Devosia ginsengisoli]
MMSMKNSNAKKSENLQLEVFKSGIVSMLYSLFTARKKQASARGEKYLMQTLADDACMDKSQLSRWFNGDSTPNWRVSSLYDLCEAMDGELRISVVDKHTGLVHSPSGVEKVVTPARSHATTFNYTVMDFAFMQDRGAITMTKCRFTQSSAVVDGRQLDGQVIALIGGSRAGVA